jgi:hypothetical protein
MTERLSGGGAGAPPPGRRREPPAFPRDRHADERIRSTRARRPAAAAYPGPDGGRLLAVDLESSGGADGPSKAQVGASQRRSGPHTRIVANAIARRRLAPKVTQSSRLRPPDAQASRSWPPLVCEPHDSFPLRAVTAASAIAWPRLSDTSSATAGGVAAALMLATSGAPGDRDRQKNPRVDRIPQNATTLTSDPARPTPRRFVLASLCAWSARCADPPHRAGVR